MKALSKTREAFKDAKIGFVGRGCAPNPAFFFSPKNRNGHSLITKGSPW